MQISAISSLILIISRFWSVLSQNWGSLPLIMNFSSTICGPQEHESIPSSALNHSLPLELISHQTSDSSTPSNKKLNPATHSWKVKPSLSSDSSGRKGWRCCAKSNQASSQAAFDSYWSLLEEMAAEIRFETRGFTSFGTLPPPVRRKWIG